MSRSMSTSASSVLHEIQEAEKTDIFEVKRIDMRKRDETASSDSHWLIKLAKFSAFILLLYILLAGFSVLIYYLMVLYKNNFIISIVCCFGVFSLAFFALLARCMIVQKKKWKTNITENEKTNVRFLSKTIASELDYRKETWENDFTLIKSDTQSGNDMTKLLVDLKESEKDTKSESEREMEKEPTFEFENLEKEIEIKNSSDKNIIETKDEEKGKDNTSVEQENQ